MNGRKIDISRNVEQLKKTFERATDHPLVSKSWNNPESKVTGYIQKL
jgi:hypothetical protein